MKKILAILIIFSSCYTPTLIEYRVTEFRQEKDKWIVKAKSARGTETFIVDCPPDSIGSRFLARPKSIKQ